MNEQWLLALETSGADATLALAVDGTVMAERSFHSERSQECDLFPPLQDLLAELPSNQRLSAIVAGNGPGSYNGARVGIAAAQAIAQFHQCPVAGLCSFEGTPEALANETVQAVGDARRGSYFILPVIHGRAHTPPQLLDEKDFLAVLEGQAAPHITFESPDRLPENSAAVITRATARGLLRSWLGRSETEQQSVLNSPAEAFYLRPPHITKSKKTPL